MSDAVRYEQSREETHRHKYLLLAKLAAEKKEKAIKDRLKRNKLSFTMGTAQKSNESN